jgi:hypothetical protein
MVFIRAYSIQDILRNINRRLTFYDIIALFLLLGILLLAFLYLKEKEMERYGELRYIESADIVDLEKKPISQIFASKSGKTYTYSWCQGAGRIKDENKVYFATEAEARATGRTLSKLCK